ncbi:MAG: isoprenylcysteine carboxylmethyltransferase family protein, partial [Nannocystaceae bacterium]
RLPRLGVIRPVRAQLQLGDAWRIGVQQGERTELRTDGLFAWCRNPIFTAMLITALAMVVWVPLSLPAWLALWAGLQLQVRFVEEPHLRRLHAEAYLEYAARTGRFWPGIGRGTTA